MWVPPSRRSSWRAFGCRGSGWWRCYAACVASSRVIGAKVVIDHGSWRHGVASGRILVHLGCLIVPVDLANDQNGARPVGDISATEREVIVRQAAVASDQEGAQVAREIAQRDDRASNGQESLGSILRKAIKMALTYERPSLPNPVCAWADKIYGLVDSIEATTELDTATFFTQNGIPAGVAIEITWWFVTFA